MKNILSYDIGRLIFQIQKMEQGQDFDCVTLSASELHVIDAIGTEAVMLRVIAERLQITKGAVTQQINHLVDKEIVEKIPNPKDRRSQLVTLTTCGREAYLQHQSMHDQLIARLMTELSSEEAITVFHKGLQVLIKALEDAKHG
ncbi:hypothetical protein GCM10007425_20840 [Lysinibacillus alkalisoli]|uniref:HTH marR-type domain-containing protein n=1 Tax=Lysinibacillus alkalisoli TaxID=1911548 RepID=A0A917LI98_9BACI|nr:MarR family transcriptional regulator [Lysinibacillus alkalisoli]GGG26110.1 hypothetical protein GCM10007425_20840 [Lysinibacillus alkalisoli]